VIDAFQPEGERDLPPDARYTRDPDMQVLWGNHPDVSQQAYQQLQAAVRERKHCFAYTLGDMPGYNGELGPVDVVLINPNATMHAKPRRYSPLERSVGDKKVAELLEAGILVVGDSRSRYISNPTLPPKRDATGAWSDTRFCVNFIPPNSNTVKDKYRLPFPEEIFHAVQGCTVYSIVDCRAAFNQLPLTPLASELTTFRWEGPGGTGNLYRYVRMPYGMCNATAEWQKRIEFELARTGCSAFAKCFVDDVLVASSSMEEHVQHVSRVLDCLHGCGLRAHPEKSIFGANSVTYLGHQISSNGISPDKAKVKAIEAIPQPADADALRSLCGLLSWFRD